MVASSTSLVGQLLIAMPSLMDPNFWRTVVLIGVHSDNDGAFGLVVNRPLDVDVAAVLEDLGEGDSLNNVPEVLSGGPVEPTHGFVLFERNGETPADEGALLVNGSIAVSGSTDTLSRLLEGSIGGRFYLLLGYAGWAPGQLEREIEENSWLVAPLDPTILFDIPPPERWTAALRSIGVEPGTLVDMGSGTPS